jgi:predicted nucleic acid-binding protein
MLVLDASSALEVILTSAKGAMITRMFFRKGEELHAPHLIDIEFAHTLRRLVREKELEPKEAQRALDDFDNLALERHAHTALLPKIWTLRNALSAYDAAYVALAEALDAPLVTCDGRLSRSHGHHADIRLIG